MAHSKRGPEPRRRVLGIKTGDDVIVLSGAGKSSTPRKVLTVLRQEGKVVVEGVNVMKDRQRKTQGAQGGQGQEVVEKPFPIDRSKVALVDPKTKKATRVKAVVGADGKKVRVAKSGETIG